MLAKLFPAIATLTALTFSGCTAHPVVRPDPANPVRSVALLPLVNNTNDLDGPRVARALAAARLEDFFYQVQPLEETDRVLRDQMGVTLGSQLELAGTRQLCDRLKVDGIVYGSLEDFNQKITGIYNAKRVRIRAKLERCATGATLWKNGVGVKSEARAGDTLLKSVPLLGNAITALGAAASVVSSLSDKNDTELAPLHGETISAPWEDISDDGSTAEVNLALGLGERIVAKSLKNPLLAETAVAVDILLHGYYDDGADLIPYGSMLPPGPIPPADPAPRKVAAQPALLAIP